MTIADGLIILATLSGPIIAVQVTRYLDDKKEERGRKLAIFKTLMATRAYTVSNAHVEALNRIDLEFSSKIDSEREVISKWKEYLDLLGDKSISVEQWGMRRIDLLVELLSAMGKSLGYKFDKVHIKNATYSPLAHGKLEEEQQAIRTKTIEVLEGTRSLSIKVESSPEKLQS